MAYKSNDWRIFIDESGSPDYFNPKKNNFGEKYFVLTAVICKQSDYKKIKTNLAQIRRKYHKYLNDLEIKSRSIRRSNPKNNADPQDPPPYDFWKYGDEGLNNYKEFCEDLKKFVKENKFYISSVGADKLFAQTKYPQKDILQTCFMDLWERIFIIHILEKITNSRILYDPKRTGDDIKIKNSYQDFIQRGTWYVDTEKIRKAKLYKHIYAPDSTESDGLQLADYCAYPVKRFIENCTCDFFNTVLKEKLYKNVKDRRTGKTIYMGVKNSLSR